MRHALILLLAGAVAAPPRPPITFSDVTKKSGLTFKFDTDLRRGRNLATMGGGVAMGDYDGDGWPDLFFTGSVGNGKKPDAGPCGVLYRNRGDGTFEDVTARAGIRVCGWTMGAAWIDLDGTGRLDLVVTGVGKTTLWKNGGDGTFREVSGERGLVAPRYAISLAAGDVNGDGRLDLYVVNYIETDYAKEQSFPQFQVRLPDDYQGQEAFLFVQQPDGRFEEGAREAGVLNRGGRGIGAVFFDYDGDGVDDLYVTNDRVANVLYHGKGDGTFEDVTVETGTGARERPPRAGMGIAVGDVDGDGHPEIFVTNFSGEPSTLYRNVEGQLFDDATEASGIEKPTLPWVQWGTDFVDLDNDGLPDLVAGSGHLVPRILLTFAKLFRKGGLGPYTAQAYKEPAVLLRNIGGGRFEDVSALSGDLARMKVSARGLAAGDVDGDGRIDIAFAAVSGGIHLMRNVTEGVGRAIEILPVAGADGHTVLGTKVAVSARGRRQVQEFILRPSYASGSWIPLHFGLGELTEGEHVRIEVTPPGRNGARQTFDDVIPGRLYRLRDGKLTAVRKLGS